MPMRSVAVSLGLALACSALVSAPVFADAIDGDWCYGGSHMEITGSSIVTPDRNKVQGNYYRYRFTYVVPANEAGAGSEISMVMIRGQEIVHLTRPGAKDGPEVWRRCKPIS